MKPITLEFVGAPWDGKTLRTDSADQEEVWLAAGCYEMSHHGAIGGECVGLSGDAAMFAQRHGWEGAEQRSMRGDHRYLVTERRETKTETETEIVIMLKYHTMRTSDLRSL